MIPTPGASRKEQAPGFFCLTPLPRSVAPTANSLISSPSPPHNQKMNRSRAFLVALCSCAPVLLCPSANAQLFGCPPGTPEWSCLPRPNGPNPGEVMLLPGLLQEPAWGGAQSLLQQMNNSQGQAYLQQAMNFAQQGNAKPSWAALTAIYSTIAGANAESVAQLAVALNTLMAYYLV